MPGKNNKLRILFLCTGNTCRSQMAEAWANHLLGDRIEAYSAGISPHAIDPRAVRVMAESGIDISGYRSKHVDSLSDIEFDYVITLCENAKETCPFFPARVRIIHAPFDDPPRLAFSAQNEEETLQIYRRVRDEIAGFVENLPDFLSETS